MDRGPTLGNHVNRFAGVFCTRVDYESESCDSESFADESVVSALRSRGPSHENPNFIVPDPSVDSKSVDSISVDS